MIAVEFVTQRINLTLKWNFYMQRIAYSLLVILMIVLIAGCGPRKLNPGTENIYLYPQAPKSCKFIGYVTDSNVHGNMDLQSSAQDLKKDDINFLKNESARLGANVVVLGEHNTNVVQRSRGGKNAKYYPYYKHNINANAYLCPPEIIQKSKQDNLKIIEIPLT